MIKYSRRLPTQSKGYHVARCKTLLRVTPGTNMHSCLPSSFGALQADWTERRTRPRSSAHVLGLREEFDACQCFEGVHNYRTCTIDRTRDEVGHRTRRGAGWSSCRNRCVVYEWGMVDARDHQDGNSRFKRSK
jgi:hypothetical protein